MIIQLIFLKEAVLSKEVIVFRITPNKNILAISLGILFVGPGFQS